jgi:hypothetical protein
MLFQCENLSVQGRGFRIITYFASDPQLVGQAPPGNQMFTHLTK